MGDPLGEGPRDEGGHDGGGHDGQGHEEAPDEVVHVGLRRIRAAGFLALQLLARAPTHIKSTISDLIWGHQTPKINLPINSFFGFLEKFKNCSC